MRRLAYQNSTLPFSFSYKIRNAFWGAICPICKSTMETDREFGIRNKIPTIQHNLPIVLGGKHELGNISVICRACNVSLQDTPTEKLNADEVVEMWGKIQ